MGADGAAVGKDVDLKTAPPLEDGEGRGDPEAAAVPCPSEDVGKLTYSVMFLCFYGFMASIRPGESFITPNLLSSEKNFTREQVSGVQTLIINSEETTTKAFQLVLLLSHFTFATVYRVFLLG